jgi:hypothetical protein
MSLPFQEDVWLHVLQSGRPPPSLWLVRVLVIVHTCALS